MTTNQILKETRIGRDGREMSVKIEAGYFVISGGEYGPHRLAIGHTSDERLAAHWDGYTRENGWRPKLDALMMRDIDGEMMCFLAVGSPKSWRNRR